MSSEMSLLYIWPVSPTAYGIHWLQWRIAATSIQEHGWMAIAFLFISILGVDVFRRAGDTPVMTIFVGLTLIYAVEIPTRLLSWSPGARLAGFFQFVTGIWLMYCTYAMTVDLALGPKRGSSAVALATCRLPAAGGDACRRAAETAALRSRWENRT
jgi:hypothetical protein